MLDRIGMRAGFAVEIITPSLPVMLAGYGARREPANAVHEELTARVLVLEDGGDRLCLVVCDLLLMTPEFSMPIRSSIAEALGIPVAAVVTSCNHIHAGPSAIAGSDAIGWTVQAGYGNLLVERCTAAARRALETAVDARMSFARGALPEGLAGNRRGHPIAPTLALLDVEAVEGGTRLGTLVNFGIHPTTTGPQNLAISTDWIGPMRAALERRAGGTAIFLQGCEGDVNPTTDGWSATSPEAWFAVAAEHGEKLADAVLALLGRAEETNGGIRVRSSRSIAAPVGDTLLARLGGMVKERRVDLIDWQLGGVRLLTIPGEGFHGLEQRLTAAHGARLLFAGLAPDWHGYLPVPYTEGYEEGLSLGPDGVSAIADALASS
jgi:hypothetical protein